MGHVPATGTPADNGAALQSALNAAVLGDTITLDPPSVGTYQGNFTLPNKTTGSGTVDIETVDLADLPAGVRVTPPLQSHAALLVTNTAAPVLTFLAGAHHYRLRGLQITTTSAVYAAGTRVPTLINEIEDGSITYALIPHDIEFDRCYIYALEEDPLPYRAAERGSLLDGKNITYKHCRVYNFMGWNPSSAIGTVASATNADPVQVTLTTPDFPNPGHKYLVTFAGGTGNWAGLNGTKVATYVSATTVSLENYDPDTFALSNVNSTSWGALSGTITRRSQEISNAIPINMVGGPGPYLIDDCFLEGYYTQLFTGGGGGTVIHPDNVVTVTAVGAIDRLTLSGLGESSRPLAVDDLIAFKLAEPQAVTAASAASPCRLTVATHRFPTGARLPPEPQGGVRGVHVYGATGAWSDLNTTPFVGMVVDATHIDLYLDDGSTPFDTTGRGALTGTVTWTPDSKIYVDSPVQWQVGKVTSINTGTKEITYAFAGHTSGGAGNGAGVPVAVGSAAQFNGENVHDITVTHSTLACRRNWIWLLRDVAKTAEGKGSPPKAFWESKMAVNALIKGNIIEISGGNLEPLGGALSLGVLNANQVGATPWVNHQNIEIESNIFRGYTYVKLTMVDGYQSGVVGTNIKIKNNLFTLSRAAWVSLEGGDSVELTHNTVRNRGGQADLGGTSSFIVGFGTNTNNVIKDNIGNWVIYGYNGLGITWTPTTRIGNHLIDSHDQGNLVPSGDVYVVDDAAMGFVDVEDADAGGDYHGYALASGSAYKNGASDGKDPGVDFALLDAALNGDGAAITGLISPINGIVLRGAYR